MFAKAQSPMEEQIEPAPLRPFLIRYDYTPVMQQTKQFFWTTNKMKDDMKWTNENMKLHKMGGGDWKLDSVGGMKLGKRENPV